MSIPNIVSYTAIYTFLLMATILSIYDVVFKFVVDFDANYVDIGPRFAIFQFNCNLNDIPNELHLKHVVNFLKKIHLRRVEPESNWDLLWTDHNDFENFPNYTNLSKNQIINRFPGSTALTKTEYFFTSNKFKFIPKTFMLPVANLNYTKYRRDYPDTLLIIKSKNQNYSLQEAYDVKVGTDSKLVQEYVNPFTINEHKFDIGAYIVVTHTNPLRAYIYSQDCYIKFCKLKHRNINIDNPDKYVVFSKNFLPIWQIKHLSVYYKTMQMGFKDTLNIYLDKLHLDFSTIWRQIENIATEILLHKENELNPDGETHNGNFFEVFKFNFVINEKLKVFLMKIESVNFLPHYPRDEKLLEQILLNALQLKGIISPISVPRIDLKNNLDTDPMLSNKEYLAVDAKHCMDYKCDEICTKKCYLCMNCINETNLNTLYQTYREHIYRYDMKRIFPKPIVLGQWYEVERSFYLPEIASGCTKLSFQPEDKNYRFEDGYFRLEVSIKTINRITGNPSISLGFAKPENAKSSIMDFKFQTRFPEILSRFLPGSGRYQVLYTDYENFAILWSCSSFGPLGHADQVWVFGRDNDFNAEIRLKIYETLKKLSLDPNRLIISKNKNCPNSL